MLKRYLDKLSIHLCKSLKFTLSVMMDKICLRELHWCALLLHSAKHSIREESIALASRSDLTSEDKKVSVSPGTISSKNALITCPTFLV